MAVHWLDVKSFGGKFSEKVFLDCFDGKFDWK